MPVRISEEKRRKIIERMILEGDIHKIAHDEDVSESTVRNVWSEARDGVYPEYAAFMPMVEALRSLNEDLKKAGLTIAQAATGLTIFAALRNLGIEPVKLPGIVGMLQNVKGEKPPQEFGQAVEQLAKLMKETGLDFQQLENLVTNKRLELDDVQAKVKGAQEELASTQSKVVEAKDDLNRTLKLNDAAFKDIEHFRESRRILRDASFTFDDIDTLAAFLRLASAEGFLEASKELHALQSETGLDFKGVVQEHKENLERVGRLRQEETKLTSTINTLTINVADLKKQEDAQLQSNNVTKKQLARLIAFMDQLKEWGIDLE